MNAGRSGITLGGAYLASAILFGAFTWYSLTNNHQADATIDKCTSNIAEYGGTSAPPSIFTYSLMKGLLWPVNLADEVFTKGHGFGDWFTTSYDPFAGRC